jgi:hypothetical protein
MKILKKKAVIAGAVLLIISGLQSAEGQTVWQSGQTERLTGSDSPAIENGLRIIEKQVSVESNPGSRDADRMLTPRRSNYSARLSDMLGQLNLAYERGWLSAGQFAELKDWQASLVRELLLLQDSGHGIVPSAYVDQMERHLNGLAYTMARRISEGSAAPAGK